MKTKQMSLWTRTFQTMYQQRAGSWIYNLIYLYSTVKKYIILEGVKHTCLCGYNIEKVHSDIPGQSMRLVSLPKPSSMANEPLIKAEASAKETWFCSSLLDSKPGVYLHQLSYTLECNFTVENSGLCFILPKWVLCHRSCFRLWSPLGQTDTATGQNLMNHWLFQEMRNALYISSKYSNTMVKAMQMY